MSNGVSHSERQLIEVVIHEKERERGEREERERRQRGREG